MALISGNDFTAEISFIRVVISLLSERKRRQIDPADIQSLEMLPNGHTKIVVRLQRDLVVPTTREEYSVLAIALNRVISETQAVELRRHETARKPRGTVLGGRRYLPPGRRRYVSPRHKQLVGPVGLTLLVPRF